MYGARPQSRPGSLFFSCDSFSVAWYMMVFKNLQMSRAKKLNLYFESEFRHQKNVLGIFDRRLQVDGARCSWFIRRLRGAGRPAEE